MRTLRAIVVMVLMLGLVGCSGGTPPVMPSVLGLQLDVALSDIERAGYDGDPEVLGGGLLGVIDKGNWSVCEQVPAAGQPIDDKPRLQVGRTCGESTPGLAESSPAAPATTPTPTVEVTQESTPEPTPPPTPEPTPGAEPVLTVADNADFAGLAALTDQCSDTQRAFVEKYAGRVLQFDGSVGALNQHENYRTRFDILVNFGDDGLGTKGPNFQFRDVSIVSDLNLTGDNVPDSMRVGDNLRITAEVDEFEPNTCLFLLEPVVTEYR